MSKQKGFTLIELIVVIVILGILAATALPKFVDLSGDARLAVIKGVEGAMRGANTMIYGKAAATNSLSGSATIPIAVPGGTAQVATTNGYATNASELAKVIDLSSDLSATSNTIEHLKATVPSNCAVTYTNTGGAVSYASPNSSASCN